jgi:hypothetical protein
MLNTIKRSWVRKVLLYTVIHFVAILLGFFLSINLSTILGQTGDWGIFSSGLLVSLVEVLSRFAYKIRRTKRWVLLRDKKRIFLFIEVLNNIKIGLLYGFFVEAFKLGS